MASNSKTYPLLNCQKDQSIDEEERDYLERVYKQSEGLTIRQLAERLKRRCIDLNVPPELLDSDIN